ncbi:hypothetical protein [Bradyrhizobium vignae]|uniref:Uncharacterized protein n=1 Tax=Bradyrhizobium vignae TaxID=1549949 RepID=A0A2U3PU90_9BRAD|nr:hypothetical protein [Bradyrhizobium vignae]SPP92696.1 conserved protein of unknown function [Bradyrhizobium vignae]
MTKRAGSQAFVCSTMQVARADGVWAMPSARALLVASLLTEPPFGCLGPSGNDRYRKRSEAVGASPVGSQVAAALSETGDRETTTAGRRDKRGSPLEPQAIDMAWVPACRSVGARAAPCILNNAIKGVFGTVCAFDRWEALP